MARNRHEDADVDERAPADPSAVVPSDQASAGAAQDGTADPVADSQAIAERAIEAVDELALVAHNLKPDEARRVHAHMQDATSRLDRAVRHHKGAGL